MEGAEFCFLSRTNHMDQIQVFISYAREDQAMAREIYRRLIERGYKPWLDVEDLLPGQDFRAIIEKTLTSSDFVIICLSQQAVETRGFFQREIKGAVDKLKEMLPEDIFVIPARLDDCKMPDELKNRHWVNLYEGYGWEILFKTLDYEFQRRGKQSPQPPKIVEAPVVEKTSISPNLLNRNLFDFVTVKVDAWSKIVDRQTKQSNRFVEWLGDGIVLEMVEISAGDFMMGSPEGSGGRSVNEGPFHKVAIPKFSIGKVSVTQAQWKSVTKLPKVRIDINADPSEFKGNNLPVERVNWYEAKEFCARLANYSGKAYRLPTEAEWEYACRAGATTPFAFGPMITPGIVNYNDEEDSDDMTPKGTYRARTTPVGSLGVANAFGLFDMHGNIWEWCEDLFHPNYYGAPSNGRAWGSAEASGDAVLRGGSWLSNMWVCRSAHRFHNPPDFSSSKIGFRVALSGEGK